MNNYLVESLVAELKEKVNATFVNKGVCSNYNVHLNKIKEMHINCGEIFYNKTLVDAHKAILKSIIWLGYRDRERWRQFSRVQNIIDKYISTGEFSLEINLPETDFNLGDEYLNIVHDLVNVFAKTGKAHSTVNCIRSISTDFLTFAQEKFSRLDDITPKTISEYYAEKSKTCLSKHTPYSLRQLFNFLYSEGYTTKNLTVSVPPLAKKTRKIMPAFSKDEINEILNSIDRSTILGKRDYAMIMLAASTGIRECDIRRLKLNNINWHTNTISIKQHKTQVPIVLPLDIATGNAVADYIINARPKVEIAEIFITTIRPYRVLAKDGSAVERLIYKCGEKFKSKGMGCHSIRRYVATSLLSESVPFTRIREILGHTQNNNLRSYIRIEHSGLAKCAIDLTGIEPTAEVYEWLKI